MTTSFHVRVGGLSPAARGVGGGKRGKRSRTFHIFNQRRTRKQKGGGQVIKTKPNKDDQWPVARKDGRARGRGGGSPATEGN